MSQARADPYYAKDGTTASFMATPAPATCSAFTAGPNSTVFPAGEVVVGSIVAIRCHPGFHIRVDANGSANPEVVCAAGIGSVLPSAIACSTIAPAVCRGHGCASVRATVLREAMEGGE
jgi:hypothetical protein